MLEMARDRFLDLVKEQLVEFSISVDLVGFEFS